MSRSLPIAILATLASLAVGAPAAHAAAYIKFDGIKGDVTPAGAGPHAGEIEIQSWAFEPARSAAGGGGGAGKVSYSDLSVVMSLEKASPLLQLAVADGKHIPTVEIRSDDKRQDYLTVTLKEVMVTSYQTAGGRLEVTLRAAHVSPGTGKTMAAQVMASP